MHLYLALWQILLHVSGIICIPLSSGFYYTELSVSGYPANFNICASLVFGCLYKNTTFGVEVGNSLSRLASFVFHCWQLTPWNIHWIHPCELNWIHYFRWWTPWNKLSYIVMWCYDYVVVTLRYAEVNLWCHQKQIFLKLLIKQLQDTNITQW